MRYLSVNFLKKLNIIVMFKIFKHVYNKKYQKLMIKLRLYNI